MKKIILGTNKNVLLNNINENNINNIKDLIGDVYFDFDIKNYGTLKNNNSLCINKYFLNCKPQKMNYTKNVLMKIQLLMKMKKLL